jgi:hypothetical protein
MTCSPAGRAVLALLLVPVLAVSMWIEVIAGTATAWAFYQPGQANDALLTLWMAFAACGPVTVLTTTIRARSRWPGMTSRVLRIEKWGLIVVLPLAFAGLVIVAMQSMI